MSNRLDTGAVLTALKSVIPLEQGAVALHEPRFAGNEWSYVK